MPARLNALFLGTLLCVTKPTAFRADDAVASSAEGQAKSCRSFIDEVVSTTVMEAFNSDGESLGCSDSSDSRWTTSNISTIDLDGHQNFTYHANASY